MTGEYKLRYKDPEYTKKYENTRKNNLERLLAQKIYKKKYRDNNKEKYKEQSAKFYSKWSKANPEKRYYRTIKARAKRLGLDFDLELSDILFPSVCPILQIPVFITEGKVTINSPSCDRVDNSKGYTKDNVRFISYKANQIKLDMRIEDAERLLAYMKNGK